MNKVTSFPSIAAKAKSRLERTLTTTRNNLRRLFIKQIRQAKAKAKAKAS
jgi:hypothetical protein